MSRTPTRFKHAPNVGPRSAEISRNLIRKNFLARLKTLKNKNADKLRRICEESENFDWDSVEDLRIFIKQFYRNIRIDNTPREFWQRTEDEEISNEQLLVEQHEREVELYAEHLLNECILCAKQTPEAICETCVNLVFEV